MSCARYTESESNRFASWSGRLEVVEESGFKCQALLHEAWPNLSQSPVGMDLGALWMWSLLSTGRLDTLHVLALSVQDAFCSQLVALLLKGSQQFYVT